MLEASSHDVRINRARHKMQKVKSSSHYPGRKIAQRVLDNSLSFLSPSFHRFFYFVNPRGQLLPNGVWELGRQSDGRLYVQTE